MIQTTIQGAIATVTLNRPDVRNAFNDETIAALTQTFTELGGSDAVRCIVLAANGKAFCAGADLKCGRCDGFGYHAKHHLHLPQTRGGSCARRLFCGRCGLGGRL
jgi:enoyl-CoA hydratase/carnithine racemase